MRRTFRQYNYHPRNMLVIPTVEGLLDKHFPDEKRPKLIDLEKNAALGLHCGHQVI